MYKNRSRRIGKAGIFAVVGGFIGAVVANTCEVVAVGVLTAGAAGVGAAAAPVLITAGAMSGLAVYGLHAAIKK